MNIYEAWALLEEVEIGTYLITAVPSDMNTRWIPSVHVKRGHDQWEDMRYRKAHGHGQWNNSRSVAHIMATPDDPFEPQFIWSLS